MKYSLTISDMTDEEFKQTLDGIGINGTSAPLPVVQDDDDTVDDNPMLDLAFDSTGLPWDERIHASSKKQNKDGTWKARKGVDDAVRTGVENEIRAQVKAAALPVGATPVADLSAFAAPAPQQFAPPAAPAYAAPQPQTQYAAPQPAYTPPVAPQAAPTVGNTFQSLMQKMQELLIGKKIAPNFAMELVGHVNQTFGVQIHSITDISSNQAMIDAAFNYIAARVQ